MGYTDAIFYAVPCTALGADHNVAGIGPPPPARALVQENVMFRASAQPVPGMALQNVYNCLVAGWDHMLTLDPSCEGQTLIGSVGWVHSLAGADRLPIYRCLMDQGDHFISLAPDCEGHTQEHILGYTN